MVKFFIKTYGCQANVADSQALSNYLEGLGCEKVEVEALADLILVNTCAIREKAEQKVFSYLGEVGKIKMRINCHLKVGVVGCIASYRKKEFFHRFDHVNFVFGAKEDPKDLQTLLADLVVKIETEKQFGIGVNKLQRAVVDPEQGLALGGFKDTPKELKQSFVNIMTGCNNYCSYCIVPFTRGREKSYLMSDILARVEQDVQNGAKEVFLLGQNVNSYKDQNSGAGFAQLLEQVANVPGEFWVRFVSPHPKDMTKDVLHVMADHSDKLCHFVHYPVQSGSNRILQAMNRTYTVEQYLEQIGWVREILPEATINTDIIVGFPGETEQDYLDTRKVMEEVKFENIFSFIYSQRKYTKAALLPDDCSKEVKAARLDALQERQGNISRERNRAYVGKNLKCLVEKRLANGKLLARTNGNIRVLLDGGDENIGQFVNIKIEDAGAVNMVGSLIPR
jgi:tRNA-2-methylthio-N6-dimethylallyladenosine synthase